MNSEIISEAAARMAKLPYNLQERALNFIKRASCRNKNIFELFWQIEE